MKNLIIIVTTLASLLVQGQKKEVFKVNVKAVQSAYTKTVCDTANKKFTAVVIEFVVLHKKDIRRFGKKIYAISLCRDYPVDAMFEDDGHENTLEFSEDDNINWDVTIVNEELLKKNRHRKKYWIQDFFTIVKVRCYLPKS